MQISIVGGGLAGIMLHHELYKRGHSIDLYDKNPIQLEQGFGFALLPNGIHCLKKYGYWDQLEPLGKPLTSVIFHNTEGKILKEIPTPGVYGFSRPDILTGLYNQSLSVKIQNCNLDYLTENNNLQCPSGTFHPDRYDLILGSDGINSNVRKLINPQAYLTSVGTFEIVGQFISSEIHSLLGNSFHKIVSNEPGLSLGLLPLSNDKVIWYLQVDRSRHGNTTFLSEELIQFTHQKLAVLNHPWVTEISQKICKPIHLWDGKKMNHFNILAEGKYFLFGDAAHAFLPFTSQGANAALEDVDCFLDLIDQNLSLSEMKYNYEKNRLPVIHQIAEEGLTYAETFCNTPGIEFIDKAPIIWKKES